MRKPSLILSASLALTAPAFAVPTEGVDVRAHYTETAVSNLHRMLSVYDAIEKDHGQPTGMKLTVFGTIEPGSEPAGDAHLYLAARSGHIAITRPGDSRFIVPTEPGLIAENPNVMAALAHDEVIDFTGQVALPVTPQNRLPVADLKEWAHKLDDRISDKAGFIAASFIRDTRRAIVDVPPGATLSLDDAGRMTPLVINRGNAAYRYTLDLKHVSKTATLVSDMPIEAMALVLPVQLGEWKR
ncbi:hypothetical protein [Kozakia baliensis]|uniref:hypothetical protein n=1 Tax=Kozakia baliensis TaxID=153496 RepID=UPI00049568FD|nr:hypothetical protein [Kozakia baliensis]